MRYNSAQLWKMVEETVTGHAAQYEQHQQEMVEDIINKALDDDQLWTMIVAYIRKADEEECPDE